MASCSRCKDHYIVLAEGAESGVWAFRCDCPGAQYERKPYPVWAAHHEGMFSLLEWAFEKERPEAEALPKEREEINMADNRESIGGVWMKTSKNGVQYLKIRIGSSWYVAFVNKGKGDPSTPDYLVFNEEPRK